MKTNARWTDYFEANALALAPIPWDDDYRITDAERRAITRSIQQFQLGEGSDGRSFIRLGDCAAARTGDHDYPAALRLFIAEEQRHSATLGRFMDAQSIPRLRQHWVDHAFRRLRRLMDLDLCITVLVTAELVANVYYAALHDATRSPCLRALCRQILRDEEAHIRFQLGQLASLRAAWSPGRRALALHLHRIFTLATILLVWTQHRYTLERGGYGFWRFLGSMICEFETATSAAFTTRPATSPKFQRLEPRGA